MSKLVKATDAKKQTKWTNPPSRSHVQLMIFWWAPLFPIAPIFVLQRLRPRSKLMKPLTVCNPEGKVNKCVCVCVCLSVCANKLVIYHRLYCVCKYFAISLEYIVELFWQTQENTAAKCPFCFNGPEFHCLMVECTARLGESNQESFNRGQIVNGTYIETPIGKGKEA